MEIQFVKPQTRAHWNKVPKIRAFKRSKVLSLSSKMRVLCSIQTNHIKHAKTIFHMVDRCFSNQFLQSKRTELTVFSITNRSQIHQKLHSIMHEKTYSGEEDDPQFLHHNNTNNTRIHLFFECFNGSASFFLCST